MNYPPHQQHPPQQPNQQQPVPIHTPPPRKYRVRFGWVAFVVIVAGIIFLLSTVGMAFGWMDVIEFAGVVDGDSFTLLAVLGGALIVLTLVARALRGRQSRKH